MQNKRKSEGGEQAFLDDGTVVTLEVLTVRVQGRCPIKVSRDWVRLVRCYLHVVTFMPLEILEVHFDCVGSQNLVGHGECVSRLRSRCGAMRIVGHGGHF